MTPITDPRRMLQGFTFDPFAALPARCFVRGCGGFSAGVQDHTRFGLVECCPDHDASKHGMVRQPAPAAEELSRQSGGVDGGSDDDGGSKVPIAPRVPKLPPGGAAARPENQITF